ncbi:MAG: type II secretion system protein [Planctomycetales bacterium]|nr:type II secretion system protein [Planctomycetales bacterium]
MTTQNRLGMSLLELLSCLMILGVLAVAVVPRLVHKQQTTRSIACEVNKQNIEIQVLLWKRQYGSWPNTNLADIGASTTFFPDGLPACPIDNGAYSIDATTGKVAGHQH